MTLFNLANQLLRQLPRGDRQEDTRASRAGHQHLLFILTVNADGNIPVAFRGTDGNVNDSRTHIETWNSLRTIAGRADFLNVATPSCVRARTRTIFIGKADASSQ